MNRTSHVLIALLALFPLSCRSSGTPPYGESEERFRVEVTVTSLDRVVLPPFSTVRVALWDLTHELEPAISSSSLTTREDRSMPVELEISYPRDQFFDSHEYVIRGEITDSKGNLLFSSDKPAKVIPNQDDSRKLELVLVSAG
jgi:uncharacterized lipoprotein YbaY